MFERYEDGSWRVAEDRLKLGKTEGQVWLTLHKLLLDRDCQQKYDFTSTKKATILQVRMNPVRPLIQDTLNKGHCDVITKYKLANHPLARHVYIGTSLDKLSILRTP